MHDKMQPEIYSNMKINSIFHIDNLKQNFRFIVLCSAYILPGLKQYS